MIKILNKVAIKRIKEFNENNIIQISSFLMSKAIDDINKTLAPHSKFQQDLTMNEFDINMQYKMWTIKNRAYRDDTNDLDVEEVLYEEISRLTDILKINE